MFKAGAKFIEYTDLLGYNLSGYKAAYFAGITEQGREKTYE